MTCRARFPNTARTRMFASTTRALPGIPTFFARRLADFLVLCDQFVFRGTPGRDHFAQFLGRRPHRLQFCFPVPFLCGDVEPKGLSVPGDGERLARLEIAGEVLAEFAYTNCDSLHLAYRVYAL